MSLHVVWFKRDLRAADHPPLVAAAARGRVLPLRDLVSLEKRLH
jgi:deoxyribodipyrimidine photo-lyase